VYKYKYVYKYHNVRAKQARAREQRVFFFLACDLTSFFAFQVHTRDRSEEYFIFIFYDVGDYFTT